jgi:hypothetical protein
MSREDGDWTTYTLPTGERIERKWNAFAAGFIPIEELDDKELHREQLRNKDGNFAGRGVEWVSKTLRRQIGAEIQRRYSMHFQERLRDAQDVYLDIMQDTTASAGDRLRAAAYVQERIVGKVPDKVEISAEVRPWEGLVGDIVNDMLEDEKDTKGAIPGSAGVTQEGGSNSA